MRVNFKCIVGILVVAATLIFSSISTAAGMSLANNTKETILNLNTNSKETYEPDAKPFMLCNNLVFQILVVTSDILTHDFVLEEMQLKGCVVSPVSVYMKDYLEKVSDSVFEAAVLITLSGMVIGLFMLLFNDNYKVITRSIILFFMAVIFMFVVKPLLYLFILKTEAVSTASNVNLNVGLSKSNAEYSVSTHDDLFASSDVTETLFRAKAAQLRTGPAKFLFNSAASLKSLTPVDASKQVFKNSQYILETDKEGLAARTAAISSDLRESWPDGKMPVSHAWTSITNDGWFTNDKENFPSTLLTYGFGLTPSSEIGNKSTDANGYSTKQNLTKAVANAPKSNFVSMFNEIKEKIKPSFIAGNTDYKNIDFSYIVDKLTDEQIASLSSVMADFRDDLTGIDYVTGVSAAANINAASQKGAGGEIVNIFKEIEKPTIDGLEFLCSQKSNTSTELNRSIIAKLNSSGDTVSNQYTDLGNLNYGCTLMTADGFKSLGYLDTEAVKAKEASVNMNASVKAMDILFNAIDKAQAKATSNINLVNEASNLVKQIRIVSLGTVAAPASIKYIAGSTNTAVQIISQDIKNNLVVNSNAANSPNLFDEDAVFGTNEVYDTAAGEKDKQSLRDKMGNPQIGIFFNKNAVTDVRNISAGKDAIDQTLVEKFTNRLNNMVMGGVPDDLRYGSGVPKNKELYEGAWGCVKSMGKGCNDTPTLYEFGVFFGQSLAFKGGMCMVGVHTVRVLFEVFKVEKVAESAGHMGKKAGWLFGIVTFIGKAAVGLILVAANGIYPYCVGTFIFGFMEGYVAPAIIDYSYLPFTVTLTVMFSVIVTYVMLIAMAFDIFNPDYRLTKTFGKKLVGIIVAIPLLAMIFKITVALLNLPSSVIVIPLLLMGGGEIAVGISGFLIIISIVVVYFYVIKTILSASQQIFPDLMRAFEVGGEKLFQDRGFFDKTAQMAAGMGLSASVVKIVETGSKEISDKVAMPIIEAHKKRQAADAAKEASQAKKDTNVDFKDLGKKPDNVK